MRRFRSTWMKWIADLEDDAGGIDSLKIFVGAVAGVGILLSGANAAGDLVRKLFPNAGRVERENRVRKRAFALAAPVAGVVGVALPPPARVLRGLRSRWFYFVVGSLLLAFALEEGIGGTFNYLRRSGFRVLGLGHLRHSVPVYAITMLLSLSAFFLAVVCAVGLLQRTRKPRFAAWVIGRTALGGVSTVTAPEHQRQALAAGSAVPCHPTAEEPRRPRVMHARTRSVLARPAPSSVLTPVVTIAAVAVFVALGLLARFDNDVLLSWDRPIRDAIERITWSPFHSIMALSSDLGNRVLLAPVTVALAAMTWRRCRQMAAVFVVALPVGMAIEFLVKFVVQRPRPSGSTALNSSFPSGHVVAGVVFWGLLPFLVYAMTRSRWLWRICIALGAAIVVAIGVSRVYIGAHWPSDSLGGLLAGAIVLLAADWGLHSHVLECDGCPLHPSRYRKSSHHPSDLMADAPASAA